MPAPDLAPVPPSALTPPTAARRPRGRPRKTALELDDGNRRQMLIAAAAKLFRNQGFSATSTRDIASAVGMHSGSPFYHFESKSALLYAVMEEGMRAAIARQTQALLAFEGAVTRSVTSDTTLSAGPRARLSVLVRHHFDVLLGPGSDFIPVMLYESRSLAPAERLRIAALKAEYEAPWIPLLAALHAQGVLKAEVKLARLLIFGALNWSVQWYDSAYDAAERKSLDELTQAAMALFIQDIQEMVA